MKFLTLGLLAVGFCTAAQLKDVKSVYFYPMSGGFEQYLASQIVANHVYQVVSDPKLADAVFTDQISEEFLYKLDHINTPPPAVGMPPHSTFSRGKGTVFLVDAKSKQVVWSVYEKPKDTMASTLEKAAKKLVGKLEIDNGMKTPKAK